jgi:glycosyltransferase involved in cell wall biosynthesis
MQNNKVISIVTIAFNAHDEGLEETVLSVIHQKKTQVEYLVIDGASQDNSSLVYEKYMSDFDLFISEKDRGISDAFNKGVRHASGQYIWFVNAGDKLADGAVESVLQFIANRSVDIIFGNMVWVDEIGDTLLEPSANYQSKIKYVMPFLHPATIMSREIFNTVGYFDLRLKRAMDYDIAIRAHLVGFKANKLEKTLAFMSAGGVHDADYLATLKEVFRVSFFSGANIFLSACALVYTYLNKKSKLFVAIKKLLRR